MERRGERERKKERARNEKKREGGMTFLPLLLFSFAVCQISSFSCYPNTGLSSESKREGKERQTFLG